MTAHANPNGVDSAYQSILDYILSFGTRVGAESASQSCYGKPLFFNTTNNFREDDLVIIAAANNTEYRLSWLKEQIVHPSGEREFLLQSAKTGNQCWWSNIGVYVMDRETLSQHKEWKWTNEQWEFKAKWAKIQKEQDEYIIRTHIEDIDDQYAHVMTRTRFGIDDLKTSLRFLWRVNDDAVLTEIHKQVIKGHEDASKEKRKQRDTQTPV